MPVDKITRGRARDAPPPSRQNALSKISRRLGYVTQWLRFKGIVQERFSRVRRDRRIRTASRCSRRAGPRDGSGMDPNLFANAPLLSDRVAGCAGGGAEECDGGVHVVHQHKWLRERKATQV